MGTGLLRRARRLFLPAHVRADIRDYELIVALMEKILDADSDCIDVGANRGLFVKEMVRIAPRGRHVAWEPLPELAAELVERFPTVDVHAAALSSAAGTADFQRDLDDSGWSGLRARPSRGDRYSQITVPVERLDDTLPPFVQPRFVKIDVEGAEEGVIRGAIETLRRHRPVIVFEHGIDAAALYGTTPESLYRLLCDELGYVISGLDGDGPYLQAEFTIMVESAARYNFVAAPTTATGLLDFADRP